MLSIGNAEIMKSRANLSSEWKFQNTKPFLPIIRQLNEVVPFFYTAIFRPYPTRFLSRFNSLAFPAVINFQWKLLIFRLTQMCYSFIFVTDWTCIWFELNKERYVK